MNTGFDVRTFVRLVLLAYGGRIEGRTKFQKLVYFVGLLTTRLDGLGYRPHYYGPYSPAVAEAIDYDRSLDFLRQEETAVGFAPAGFERSRFDFELTEDGRVIAEREMRRHPGLSTKISEAVNRIHRAGDLDYVRLSIAAKTWFLLSRDNRTATAKEIELKARTFGWNVSESEIQEAAGYLANLGLASSPGTKNRT